MASIHRQKNLDLLRAVAIILVLIYHLFVQWPVIMPWVRDWTTYGQYGVDLFFVLSGWLIGGLYWRERFQFGDVHVVRFWTRRWIRTLPPYYAALLISWLAVYAYRNQPWDWGYVIFVQNFYRQISFFMVSWSLAIEEHFYLFGPLLLLAWGRLGRGRAPHAFFAMLLLLGIALRAQISEPPHIWDFDYRFTATPLHMDGLIIGFWLSYLSIKSPKLFENLVTPAPLLAPLLVVMLGILRIIGAHTEYLLWNTTMSLFFACLLLWAVSAKPLPEAICRVSTPIALASYSIYLSHPWVLAATRIVAQRYPENTSLIYFPLSVLGIMIFGTAFWFAFEKSSIAVRDRYWPRRSNPTLEINPDTQPPLVTTATTS